MTAATRLYDAIKQAHMDANLPSSRTIAHRITAVAGSRPGRPGELRSLSHGTVNNVLRGRTIPRLDTLLLIVDALAADRETFKALWQQVQAADDALPRASGSRTAEPAVSLLSAEHIVEHLRRAEELFKESAYEEAERHLDLAAAGTLHNKARILHTRCCWTESESVYRETLKTRRHLLGDEDEETLATRNNLALVIFDQGRVEEAQPEHDAVYLAFRKLYGDEHPKTLACRYNQARALHRGGHLSDAEEAFRSALAALRRTPDRLFLLTVQNNLGRVLYDLGDLPAARVEFEAVLSAQRETLSPDHADLLRTRHNIALVLRGEGRLDEAEREFKDVLKLQRQVLGERHAHVFDTRHHLALLDYDRRRFGLAEEGFRRVMGDQTGLLGAGHPDTLRTRRNRALALSELGDVAAAAQELHAVVELQERTLGAGHDETAQTRRNLAGLTARLAGAGPGTVQARERSSVRN